MAVSRRGRADVRAEVSAPDRGRARSGSPSGRSRWRPSTWRTPPRPRARQGSRQGGAPRDRRHARPRPGARALAYQAGRICFARDGVFTVALSPGRYEALIGRGPEFTLETRRFEVAYGRTTPVEASIRRVVATEGWVIADFHNHTTASNDSIADPGGRVVGLAASGVEFAPATEHNRISTYAPSIEAERLTPFLHSAGGIELSGRPGPGATNHQNAFPLRVREGVEGGGAPRTDRDPKVQIGHLFHHDDAEKFVQQNHPDVGWLYFDKDQDGAIDGGFGTRPYTHAMEINRDIAGLLKSLESAGDGAKAKTKPGRAFHWLQMLNQGDRIYGTANSDAHVTAFNNGSIFTYIQSGTDDPASLDPAELARAAKGGRMVMSNGPFLEVSVDGVPPGGDARAIGEARLEVRARWAGWIDVDRVQVLVNGRPDPSLNWTRAGASDGFLAGPDASGFSRDVPLKLAADAHVIVIATGEASRIGPFHGPHERHAPTALSNPIFIDVDGGGFAPNKDTLGAPLPVSSRAKPPAAELD
ncbi:MAG: CehA/McbA family metallohydrolase [Singulisphaera sp.]